uniref:F-box domain-containing protein n=1 Tax=Tetradesmus obliquus TaxID=3088 RepID=A0A383W177_TETOB
MDKQEYSHLVVQLLQPALLAALLPAAAATAQAGATAVPGASVCTQTVGIQLQQQQQQQQQQQRCGLRLASFSCTAPGGAALLALLPPHSLTELTFGSCFSGPAVAAALARLSSLQRLHLIDCYGCQAAAWRLLLNSHSSHTSS